MASKCSEQGYSDAMFGIVFDGIAGVKKQSNYVPAINYTTSAIEPSTMLISTTN